MPSRINPDSFYVPGFAWTSSQAQTYWRALDTAQSNAVNGDTGGTWNPASQITIAGAGMWCCGPWSIGNVAGNIVVNSTTTPMQHGDNDYDVLAPGHTGASITKVTNCSEGFDLSGGTAAFQNLGNSLGSATYTYGSSSGAPRAVIPLRVHDGATFASVTLTFVVVNSHAGGVPQSLPSFRVYRVDAAGNVTALKTSSVTGAGYVYVATPASGAAWHNGGSSQTLVYTLDGGIVVNRSQYEYFAEIVDESGQNATGQNDYISCACAFTGIPDLRPD